MAYILKGHFAWKVPFFILAIPIAIFANLFRLVALLLIGNQWGAEAALRFFHTAFSPLFFLVAIICLLFLAGLLGFRFREAAR